MSQIRPMGTRPILLSPALFTFKCFTDPAWREVNHDHLLDGVEHWSWNSAESLREACVSSISRQMGIELNAAEKLFSFDEYTDLNRGSNRDNFTMTWFIATGIGHLFCAREVGACPWKDPDLFVPAKWGRRVVMAVEMGLARVSWGMHSLECGRFDGGTHGDRPLTDLLK